jgi:hypothetical protein
VQISPNIEGVGKSLELEHGGTMEAGAVTVKDVSVAAVGRKEARIVSIADYESGLRREG